MKNEGIDIGFISHSFVMKSALLKKYKELWNSTAKDGYKWKDNPYVFVYEFERVEIKSN